MRRLQTGQKLNNAITAGDWNEICDMVEFFRRLKTMTGGGNTERLPAGVVLIENASGSDQDRCDILGIDSVVISSADNIAEFKSRPVLSCITPAADYHTGKFVVLYEPIANGKLGYAWVTGVCPVQIQSIQPEHLYADITDSDTSKLTSHVAGGARILWRADDDGLGWALVQLGETALPRIYQCTSGVAGGEVAVKQLASDGSTVGNDIALKVLP